MIPAGPERDKRIAELRGHGKDYCEIDRCPYGSSPCNECHLAEYKPYSTDISAAMELWDEMADKNEYISLVQNKNRITLPRYEVKVSQDTLENDYIVDRKQFNYVADTIADAISGAWLKWREAK